MRQLMIAGVVAACSTIASAEVVFTSADVQKSVDRVVSGSSGGPEAVVYTNNVETGSRFNVGVTTTLMYDDVPLPAAVTGNAAQLEITRITMGIRQAGGQPASSITMYAFTPDDVNGLPLNNPPTPLGTVPIDANTTTAFRTFLAVLGDGVTPLATVDLNYNFFSPPAAFGTLMVGGTLSTADGLTGLRITNGPAGNSPAFGLARLAVNPWDPATDGFGYSFGAAPAPAGTFYIVLEGNFVPEPASLSLLAMSGLMLGRRRRA